MKKKHSTFPNIKLVLLITFCFVATAGYSQQKATDTTRGVGGQLTKPELLKMKGTIEKIESVPSKYGTGRSFSGTHLLVNTDEKLVDVHLGPALEVSKLFSATKGDLIIITVFRTDGLPQNQYIAKEVIVNGKTTVFRDETLRPVWAGKYPQQKWRKRN